MKKLIAWSVCVVLGGSLMAHDGNDANNAKDKKAAAAPADAPAVLLVFEFSDGSRVIGTPFIDRFKIKTKLAGMEFLLSRSRMIEFAGANHTAQVSLQNGDVLSGELAATEIAVKTDSGQVLTPLAKVSNIRIRAGSIGGDYVNSLGVEFVFVPGTKVLFSIWDTRLRDYRAYAEANPGVYVPTWKDLGIKQGEDDPVMAVTWEQAKIFCAWLTQKERKEGKIGEDQEYRLPTDKEWSAAVGKTKYPWGNEWPPPKGAGNYADETRNKTVPGWSIIEGYDDGYAYTSPVGSFKANQYGLYDMGGNVWQMCEDWYDPTQRDHVLRGAAWDSSDPESLLSSARSTVPPRGDGSAIGFRCVLAPMQSSR